MKKIIIAVFMGIGAITLGIIYKFLKGK